MSKFKQNSIFCFLVFLSCIAWMGLDVPMVLAQAGGIGAPDTNLGNPVNGVLSVLSQMTVAMKAMILFVLQFLEYFMNTDFYSAPGMSSALKNIWKVSRDIMNYIFLFLLLGAALYTVIKANKDFIKEKLGSFVIAVICVNFSWFFPRVVIDIASVLTNTVFSLPSFVQGSTWTCINGANTNGVVTSGNCRVMVFDKDSFEPDKYGCNNKLHNEKPCECDKMACWEYMSYGDARTKKGYGYSTFNTFATSIVNIPNLDKIFLNAPGPGGAQPTVGWQSTIKLGIGIFINSFILLATLFPLIALCIALMIRIVIIWVCTAFMPFSFLGYAVKGEFGSFLAGDYNIWKEFTGAVFIPVYFGIPMSIGIIMLSATASIPAPGGTVKIPFLAGVNGMWGFTWMIAALAIMWIGTFASFRGSKIIGAVTDKVKGIGEQMGGGLANIAAAEIAIPLPGKGGSISGLDALKIIKNPSAVLGGVAENNSDITKFANNKKLTKEEANALLEKKAGGKDKLLDPSTRKKAIKELDEEFDDQRKNALKVNPSLTGEELEKKVRERVAERVGATLPERKTPPATPAGPKLTAAQAAKQKNYEAIAVNTIQRDAVLGRKKAIEMAQNADVELLKSDKMGNDMPETLRQKTAIKDRIAARRLALSANTRESEWVLNERGKLNAEEERLKSVAMPSIDEFLGTPPPMLTSTPAATSPAYKARMASNSNSNPGVVTNTSGSGTTSNAGGIAVAVATDNSGVIDGLREIKQAMDRNTAADLSGFKDMSQTMQASTNISQKNAADLAKGIGEIKVLPSHSDNDSPKAV